MAKVRVLSFTSTGTTKFFFHELLRNELHDLFRWTVVLKVDGGDRVLARQQVFQVFNSDVALFY